MGSLLLFEPVEEAAFSWVEDKDIEAFRAYSVDLPCVSMHVVLDDSRVEEHDGRDGSDAGNRIPDAIDVILFKANSDAGFVGAGLFGSAAAIDLDVVDAPLGKDVHDGSREAGAVGQQQHNRGDAPSHADHGDGGAAAVVDHGFPGLGEDVFQHEVQLLAPSFQLSANKSVNKHRNEANIPSGAKAQIHIAAYAARLKSCPFKTPLQQQGNGAKSSDGQQLAKS